MKLLVCIVKNHRHAEDILTGFLELGVRGATVVDGRGMGQIVASDIPIFAGFKSLFPVGGGATYLVLSVMDAELSERAIKVIDEVCGSLDKPGAGIAFTIPVDEAYGLAEEIR
jgi:nitrogen regulatory protein PII